MARETKTQVWTNVQNQVNELLEGAKIPKKFSEQLLSILEANIAPKSGGGSSINPPKLNEAGEIVEAYCRFHDCYEPVENMVISNKKSKGYCKASISLWNKTNSQIKKLNSEASEFMAEADFDNAQKVAKEAKALKDTFNLPAFFDLERDWAVFNGTTEA